MQKNSGEDGRHEYNPISLLIYIYTACQSNVVVTLLRLIQFSLINWLGNIYDCCWKENLKSSKMALFESYG